MIRAALGVASAVALLVVAGGASVSAASAAGPVRLPGCDVFLTPTEVRLVGSGGQVRSEDFAEGRGTLVCNWGLKAGTSSVLVDFDAKWIDPTTAAGQTNLDRLGQAGCDSDAGAGTSCTFRDELTDAKTANEAFRVIFRWLAAVGLDPTPFRIATDPAFWITTPGQGKTDLYLLLAGGRAGILLHTACARVEKNGHRVAFPRCTKEAMNFARANFRGWLKTR